MDETIYTPPSTDPGRADMNQPLTGTLRRGSTVHPSAATPGTAGAAATPWFRTRWFQSAAASLGALGAFMFWRRRARA